MVQIVHYVKSDCDSGYVCAMFTRVAENVVSTQFGQRARNPTEACTDMYFSKQPSNLLMSRSHVPTGCPLNGRYSLEYAVSAAVPSAFTRCGEGGPSRSIITAGCGSAHLKVESLCLGAGNVTVTDFKCQASWTRPGLNHVVLSEDRSDRLLCLTYSDRQGRVGLTDCGLGSAQFLLRETGPCLQALSSVSLAVSSTSLGNLYSISFIILISLSANN